MITTKETTSGSNVYTVFAGSPEEVKQAVNAYLEKYASAIIISASPIDQSLNVEVYRFNSEANWVYVYNGVAYDTEEACDTACLADHPELLDDDMPDFCNQNTEAWLRSEWEEKQKPK
jgi:hypothetical protein